MELTFQSLLLFLRKLVSFFRKRWNQSNRRLWYIFAFLRSRFSPPQPKKRDDIRRSIESLPANPPKTVICASRLPTIAGGDTPVIASPTPHIALRRPTEFLSEEDPPHEDQEDYSSDHLYANYLEGSATISRSHNSADHHDEQEHTNHLSVAQSREDLTSTPPVIPSRPPSQHSHSQLHHAGYRPPSQYSRPPSVHSFRSPSYLNGAETAARGYLPAPPSPKPSSLAPSRPPSIAVSLTSQPYRASRPTNRVPRPSPVRNASQRRGRSSTPASRQSVHEAPPGVPSLPQSVSQTSVSIHHGPHNAAVSLGSLTNPKCVLRPMIEVARYEKQKLVIIDDIIHTHVLPPVTTKFERDSIPERWVALMHPEGVLYWIIKEDFSRNPIYTDTNMCEPVLRQRIEEAVEEINNRLKDLSPRLPEDWELALELDTEETGELICKYYFVCNTTRCLFWLEDHDIGGVLGPLAGVTENTHIHLALQVQYWSHWEMFPHNREVPASLAQELTGILIHAGIDCMTSPNSTAVYSEGDLSKFLGYVRHIKSAGGDHGFSACVIGRLMSFFTHSRYSNFYGQKGARLTNDQTIYGYQPKRTPLIKILSIFFFYAPELHLRGLESVYTDFIICQHRWQQFITKLQEDWREFILFGTVLLNANVAFLAIPSVDPGNHNRTPTQLASYLSVIISIGSVVTGLLLLRQHRTKPQAAAEEVEQYLQSRHHSALGFETLAILYSLPYSLLLWATMAFATALSLEAIVFSRQLWTKLPVGIALALIMMLISWCVLTSLEAKNSISVLDGVHVLKEYLVGLRGKISASRPDAGDTGDDDGQGASEMLDRTGSLKGALNRLRRPRRPRRSTVSTLVNPSTPDRTAVEMCDMNNEETRSAV